MKLPPIIEQSRSLRERVSQQRGQQSAGTTGCICPPIAERACKNPTCPRQDHRTMGQKLRDANVR